MVPTRLKIYPRPGMSASWSGDNNPAEIVVKGLKYDMLEEEIFRASLPLWDNTNPREWDIFTDRSFIGYRVYVPRTVKSDRGDSYHTGWAHHFLNGAYGVGDVYIEKHAYWWMPHNEQGGIGHLEVDYLGTSISFKQNTSGAKAQNFKFKDRSAEDG
jgi:hypothetical protein